MIVHAGWFMRRILRLLGLHGLVMPWGTGYILAEHDSETLRAHEQTHLDQLARMGAMRFAAVYLWQLARDGYYWHPMEIEARVRSGEWKPEPHWQKDPRLRRYWKGGRYG